MLLPGELTAITTIRSLGAEYGYGNLRHHLAVEWAADLVVKYGMSEESALLAATVSNVTAYDVRRRVDELKKSP
jgi:imidazolonepropionase-like amidohydrolase